jgi:hypothetical protein
METDSFSVESWLDHVIEPQQGEASGVSFFSRVANLTGSADVERRWKSVPGDA